MPRYECGAIAIILCSLTVNELEYKTSVNVPTE